MFVEHPIQVRRFPGGYHDTHDDLIQAICDNELQTVSSLLKHSGQLNKHGYTALAVAASRGNYGACKLLVEKEAGHKTRVQYKLRNWKFNCCSALMMAAWHGHTNIVQLLVKYEAGMRDGYWGVTALMGAAHTDLLLVCKALKPYEAGCLSTRGYSALMWAIMGGSKECFDLLLEDEYMLEDGEALPLAVQHEFLYGVEALAPLLIEISGKRALQRIPKTELGILMERVIRNSIKPGMWI